MADKKNSAERFTELVELHRKGAITVKQFEEKKARLLAEPVSDTANDTTELAQWFELREQGHISQDEYEKRADLLINSQNNPTQPNVPQNQAPVSPVAPPPAAPKKKKSLFKKVLWGLAIVAAIAGVGRSCSSGNGKRGPVKQPDYSATQVVDLSAQLKSEAQKALEGKEDWRQAFEERMVKMGLDENTKAFLHHGITDMSCYSVMMKLPPKAEYADLFNTLTAKRKEVAATVNPKYRAIYNAVFVKEAMSWNHKINKEGVKDVPMDQVQDRLIKRLETFILSQKNMQRGSNR